MLLLLLGALLAFPLWWLAWLLYWSGHDPATTPFMAERVRELATSGRGEVERRWRPYAEISPHLKRAVVAAEDARFLDHDGFDWDALERAARRNLSQGRVVSGGSTISNQLAKNLFLSPDRNLLRKGQEAVITLLMEGVMAKRRILEIYLNVIEWGERVYGAEAAARHYFGIGAGEVNREQAALLAAMIPNPRHYDRQGVTPHLRRKSAVILERMAQARIP